jgi:hypothetical protein
VRLQIHRSSQNKTAQGSSLGPSSFYFFQRELSGFPTINNFTSESSNRQAIWVSGDRSSHRRAERRDVIFLPHSFRGMDRKKNTPHSTHPPLLLPQLPISITDLNQIYLVQECVELFIVRRPTPLSKPCITTASALN